MLMDIFIYFFSALKKAKSQEERDQENAKRKQELEKRLQVCYYLFCFRLVIQKL